MPGMSGAEVAKRLREMWPVEALTLVAVSGHDKAHLSVRNGAFDHYLLKPVTKQDVVTLLNSLPIRRK